VRGTTDQPITGKQQTLRPNHALSQPTGATIPLGEKAAGSDAWLMMKSDLRQVS